MYFLMLEKALKVKDITDPVRDWSLLIAFKSHPWEPTLSKFQGEHAP